MTAATEAPAPTGYQYRTTCSGLLWVRPPDHERTTSYVSGVSNIPFVANPITPAGDGWELVSTVTGAEGSFDGADGGSGRIDTVVIWTWRRPRPIKRARKRPTKTGSAS